MQGRGSGFGVRYNGKYGIIFKQEQKRKFRCPCCGNSVSKEGKAIVVPTDKHFGIKEDETKKLVPEEDIKVITLID